jgi:cadmium resistance protein CadD (predicted permease)
MDNAEKAVLFVVFLLMVYVWRVIARYLAEHKLLASSLSKYAHLIMPIVLFALGIFILYESKSLTLVF